MHAKKKGEKKKTWRAPGDGERPAYPAAGIMDVKNGVFRVLRSDVTALQEGVFLVIGHGATARLK